jgi:hypothetical protein
MTKTKEEFIPITIRDMCRQPRPSDLLTWTMCRHLCRNNGQIGDKKTCELCPRSRPDIHYRGEDVIDGCRVLAEEYARLAMAALTKEGWRPPE